MFNAIELVLAGLLAGLIAALAVIRRRGKKKLFEERLSRAKVTEEARVVTSRAIRHYLDWLRSVSSGIGKASDAVLGNPGLMSEESYRKLYHLCLEDERIGKWVSKLEEHETVFPKTANYRFEIFRRDSLISTRLYAFLEMVHAGNKEGLGREKDQIGTLIQEQVVLLNDLLIHLQNYTFRITTRVK